MSDDVSLTAYVTAAMLELDANVEVRPASPPLVCVLTALRLPDRSRWFGSAWTA